MILMLQNNKNKTKITVQVMIKIQIRTVFINYMVQLKNPIANLIKQ